MGPGRVVATNRQVGLNDSGDDTFDIFEAFAPEPDDMVIVKERASGFYGTALVAYLTKLGIDSLIVSRARLTVFRGYQDVRGLDVTVDDSLLVRV